MKRTLLTAITLYLLYDRQKRVEARVKAWQRGLGSWGEAVNADLRRFAGEVNDSQSHLVKEVERAFKRASA